MSVANSHGVNVIVINCLANGTAPDFIWKKELELFYPKVSFFPSLKAHLHLQSFRVSSIFVAIVWFVAEWQHQNFIDPNLLSYSFQ